MTSRTIVFFCFWLLLTRAEVADLPAGAVATAAATWASLRLLPPLPLNIRPLKLAGLVVRFLRQSIVAGIDVALRALSPRLLLQPGFVIYHPILPPGPLRDEFCAITSLLPGTLPSGFSETGGLVVHCLDVTQPVTAQLAEEETLFILAFGGKLAND